MWLRFKNCSGVYSYVLSSLISIWLTKPLFQNFLKIFWGQTDRRTNRPTDRQTKRGIEVPCRSLKRHRSPTSRFVCWSVGLVVHLSVCRAKFLKTFSNLSKTVFNSSQYGYPISISNLNSKMILLNAMWLHQNGSHEMRNRWNALMHVLRNCCHDYSVRHCNLSIGWGMICGTSLRSWGQIFVPQGAALSICPHWKLEMLS